LPHPGGTGFLQYETKMLRSVVVSAAAQGHCPERWPSAVAIENSTWRTTLLRDLAILAIRTSSRLLLEPDSQL